MIQSEALAHQKIERFFTDYTKLLYKRGEVILRAEDPPAGVYFLKSGFVRQYLISPSGETLILHVYRPGSFFPLMWAINNIPNNFYFEAVTAVEVYRAPQNQVVTFLKKHPDILFETTQRLIGGLHGLVSRVGYLVLDNAYIKTVLLILYFAKNFAEPSEVGVSLRVPLVHREIAAWIGTTRETASLQMEALKRKGLIKARGRKLIVPNLHLLEAEFSASRKTN